MSKPVIYLIGSLRNPRVAPVAKLLEDVTGFEVFADWKAAAPDADDAWRDYIKARQPGAGIKEALASYAAEHVFSFDKKHLERADAVVLLMPAGKSGFLELGYALGKGKPGFIVFEEDPERYDVMFLFATGIATSVAEVASMVRRSVVPVSE